MPSLVVCTYAVARLTRFGRYESGDVKADKSPQRLLRLCSPQRFGGRSTVHGIGKSHSCSRLVRKSISDYSNGRHNGGFRNVSGQESKTRDVVAQALKGECGAEEDEKESKQRDAEIDVALKDSHETVWDEKERPLMDEDVRVLTRFRSRYNFVQVLEVARGANHVLAGARMLLLDNPGNIHSIYYQHKVLTCSYYDEFATLVPLLPQGPVGILGLGAGTAAHIIHHFWPTVSLHGWELDPDIISVAREFFNLSWLEQGGQKLPDESVSQLEHVDTGPLKGCSYSGKFGSEEQGTKLGEGKDCDSTRERYSGRESGRLTVHTGDALGPNANIEAGFAGLIVDLFADGAVIPALQQPQTWQQLRERLCPGGRIMVNCGGSMESRGNQKSAGQVLMEETIAAVAEIFPGETSTRYLARKAHNTLALTGPPPNVQAWKQALPKCLTEDITDWVTVP